MTGEPRGRPQLVRNVYAFDDESVALPKEATLDTSFVVKALSKAELEHQACQAYVTSLAEAGCVISYNRILEVELAEVSFKIAVRERHGAKGWPSKRNDGRVRRRAGRLQHQFLDAWTDLLHNFDFVCVELQETAPQVPDAMSRWGLGSYDAVHATTALYIGSGGLITCDAGFGNVPARSLRLYVDSSRVRSCRRRRGSRMQS